MEQNEYKGQFLAYIYVKIHILSKNICQIVSI